ncbi:MAG TPA: UDP-N-acetylglucosamine 2-epimerase (non-hydrolyzing) [Fluviicola sp.]|nr:UDP-N-acetylglucosamine 2-epimerase (non-hydrolyzing) [Fluviicola sp.]
MKVINKTKVLLVFGTRPEAIKMSPLIKEFQKYPDKFETKVCVTAQHREMLDQVLNFFEIVPAFDLDLMKPNQNLFDLTGTIISSLKTVFDDFSPGYTFVHGDTTTTFAASLAAFYAGSKVCHVEAGLRTNDKFSPFPEEMNRQLTSRIADLHFAPTETSKQNLLNENIPEQNIIVTGNTVIDALLQSVEKVKNNPSELVRGLEQKLINRDVIIVTGHRRENHGQGFENICKALKEIADSNPNINIIYPVHLNPNVLKPVKKWLDGISNIILIEPLDYPDFVWLMNRSKIILTDSGGVQEEAPSLGKPVLVMRNTTERPEAIDAGTVKLVGTNIDLIVKTVNALLNNKECYYDMALKHNPYGDGLASKKIIEAILHDSRIL